MLERTISKTNTLSLKIFLGYNLGDMERTQEYGDKNITRTLIVLIIILAFAIFLLSYVLLPIDKFNTLTESFNRIAVGLSALTAVIFGPTLVSREIEKDRKIKEYLKRFPHNKFSEAWEIIDSEKFPGAIYVLDKKVKTKHHILNMKTVYDLGWHIYPRKTIENSLFQQYKVGDTIRTQGEAGE